MISALHFPKFREREFQIPLIHVVETKLTSYSDGSWTSRKRAEPIDYYCTRSLHSCNSSNKWAWIGISRSSVTAASQGPIKLFVAAIKLTWVNKISPGSTIVNLLCLHHGKIRQLQIDSNSCNSWRASGRECPPGLFLFKKKKKK